MAATTRLAACHGASRVATDGAPDGAGTRAIKADLVGSAAIRMSAAPAATSASAALAEIQKCVGFLSASSPAPASRTARRNASALRREKCRTPSTPRQSIRRRGRKNRSGNGAIDHGGADDKALPGKTAGEIAGTIGAGKIEQRGSAFDALGDQAGEVAHVAIGGCHIRKAGRTHGLRAAPADREYGAVRATP